MQHKHVGFLASITLLFAGFMGCIPTANKAPTTQSVENPPVITSADNPTGDKSVDVALQVERLSKIVATLSGTVAAIPTPATPVASIITAIGSALALGAHTWVVLKNNSAASKGASP